MLFLHAPRCWISRLAYRHASPQVMVLRGGRVVWSASRFSITATAVRRACRAGGDERSPQG